MPPVDLLQLVDLAWEEAVDEVARLPLLEHLLDLGLHLQVPHEVQVVLEDGVGNDVLPAGDVQDPLPVGHGKVLEREVEVLEVGRVDAQPPAERSCQGLLGVGAGWRAVLVGEENLQPVRVAVREDEHRQGDGEDGDELSGGQIRNSLPRHHHHPGELPLGENPLLQQPLENRVFFNHEDEVGIHVEVEIRNVLENYDENENRSGLLSVDVIVILYDLVEPQWYC